MAFSSPISPIWSIWRSNYSGKIRETKNPRLLAQHCFVASFSRFSLCMINLSRNKNACCWLKKFVSKSRARVYFEQQILALLLVFHQTHNLSRNKFANQLISALHFFKNGKHRPKLTTKQCCATS